MLLKKIALLTTSIIAAYFVSGTILSRIVFPSPEVDLVNYSRPGDQFVSRVEGFQQTVLAVNQNHIHTRLEILPHAAGPPEHIHEAFEERFTVREGEVNILVNGEKKTLKPGETVTIPPMTPHKPFNETDRTAVIQSDQDLDSLPVQFGYFLSQMYPIMDREGGNLDLIMQLSVFGNEMDSWLVGPPIIFQKTMRILLEPTARLLGYKKYYPEFRPSVRAEAR